MVRSERWDVDFVDFGLFISLVLYVSHGELHVCSCSALFDPLAWHEIRNTGLQFQPPTLSNVVLYVLPVVSALGDQGGFEECERVRAECNESLPRRRVPTFTAWIHGYLHSHNPRMLGLVNQWWRYGSLNYTLKFESVPAVPVGGLDGRRLGGRQAWWSRSVDFVGTASASAYRG